MSTQISGNRSATDIIRQKLAEQQDILDSNDKEKTVTTKKAPKTRATRAKGKGKTVKGNVIPAQIAKLPTKAAKIRALWTKGWTRNNIAKALGISFQHVYNTTMRPTKGYQPK